MALDAPWGDPLVSGPDGVPQLYPALGAILHLEPLVAEDEGRLEAVTELVWEWFGPALRWVGSSFQPVAPAVRGEADYISGYARRLNIPPADTPFDRALHAALAQFTNDDFEVAFCGGATPVSASPYSYRFFAEVPDAERDHVKSYGVIHLTVPESWPLADFRARVCAIAAAVRLRWGVAGYTYSPWIIAGYAAAAAKIMAHTRRYPGYDVAEYVRLVKSFYARIRTVGWLTFLGPTMVAELKEAGCRLESASRLVVDAAGESMVIVAGERPERGDVNRLVYPAAYVEADELLRVRRARSGEGMVFLGPWEDRQITDWLCRFEKRVS